jgi:hypothetical protein
MSDLLEHLDTFEQTTVSPHVLQFMTDYLFIRDKLINSGIDPVNPTEIGDADVALSIVNDAYEHRRRILMTDSQIVGSLAVDNS